MSKAKNLLNLDMYYKAIEGSESGLWVCDIETEVCYLSNRYYSMLGYEPDEFEGTLSNLFTLVHPDDVEKTAQVLAPVYQGKNDSYRNEVRLRKKSGEYIDILTQGQVERDENQKITKLIGWNIDISPLKEAQRKLDEERSINVANVRLAQLGLLSGGIAHEINNPLTVIQMRTEMMKKSIQNNVVIDRENLLLTLNQIQTASKKINAIIQGLSTMANGGSEDQKTQVLLKEVVDEVLAICNHEIDKKGISLHIKISNEQVAVLGNFALLSQVLLNLIQNASDALESKTEKDIWIEVTQTPGLAIVSIEDNGVGVKKEDVDKIMLPFFTTKPPGKGTGLGLSISKSIINTYGGDLNFREVQGRSKFTVTLPLMTTV